MNRYLYIALLLVALPFSGLASGKVTIQAEPRENGLRYKWLRDWLTLDELTPKVTKMVPPTDREHHVHLSLHGGAVAMDARPFLSMLRDHGYPRTTLTVFVRRKEPPFEISIIKRLAVDFVKMNEETLKGLLIQLDSKATEDGVTPEHHP